MRLLGGSAILQYTIVDGVGGTGNWSGSYVVGGNGGKGCGEAGIFDFAMKNT